MTKITAVQVKKLREATGAGILAVKKALEEAKGDESKARQILNKKGLEKMAKRGDKEAREGQVYAYTHAGGSVAGMVKINCETDFVAKSEDFVQLAKELAMQVASMNPKDIKDLLAQKNIRDTSKTVKELVDEVATRVKEKVIVSKIARMSL